MMHRRDSEFRQMLLRADAGQHEQLRRVDRAAAQDHFARRQCGALLAVDATDDTGRSPPDECDFFGERIGDDAQIGAAHCRSQIPDRGRAAPAVARRRLVIADAVLMGAVKIVVARKPRLRRTGDERFADRMLRHIRHAEWAARAVETVGATHLVLRAPEIGQYVVERPAGIAELAPMVEILGLATDIDHAVDRRGAAEHLAARPEDAAVGGARIGFGLVAPIDRGIGKGLTETERDMDPAVGVLAARLDQHDARRRILGEARRHRTARRARANDDEISLDLILLGGHCLAPRRLHHPILTPLGQCRHSPQRWATDPFGTTDGDEMAFTFDSLSYAKHLRDNGVPQQQAEAHAEAAKMFIMNELVTKEDLRTALEMQTLRLTVRMGVLLATGLTLLGAVLKLHS